MDSTRQAKISRLLQKELSSYFQREARNTYGAGIISVTVVRVSPDLSVAKVYLSIFPGHNQPAVYSLIEEHARQIRFTIGQLIRHQLRVVPELAFFIDDSLEYAHRIDELLKE